MKIFTIGHGTRSLEDFIEILQSNRIKCMVDVRRYPHSKRVPYFDMEKLAPVLAKVGIAYVHLDDLGGRRHLKSTLDTSIQHKSFAAYAAYMRTNQFGASLHQLKKIARKCRTVIMCAETVWWRCHRRMIADRLGFDGWQVYHLGLGRIIRHPIWQIARLDRNNDIVYDQ